MTRSAGDEGKKSRRLRTVVPRTPFHSISMFHLISFSLLFYVGTSAEERATHIHVTNMGYFVTLHTLSNMAAGWIP